LQSAGRKERHRRLLVALAAFVSLAALGETYLLVTGRRVLLSQRIVRPGEHYAVDGYGDVGAASQASLVCTYFTGRHLFARVFWHSPNNILGREHCPTILNANE